jgi:hypothetical protein
MPVAPSREDCDRAMAWWRQLSPAQQHDHYRRSGVQVPFETWRMFGHFAVRYWQDKIKR